MRLINKNNQKRTMRVFMGFASIILFRFFSLALGLLLTGILARYLTSEEFGLWAILTFTIGIIPVLDIGVGLALRNKLSILYSDNNKEQGRETFFAVFYSYIGVAGIFILLLGLAKNKIPWDVLFNTDNSVIISKGSFSFILALIILIISLPFTVSTAGFFSYQQTHWNSFFEFLKSVFTFFFIGLLVLLGIGYTPIVASFAVAMLLPVMISFFTFLRKRRWEFIFIRFKTIVKEMRELFSKSIQFGVMQICSTLIFSMQALIVGKTAGLKEAGEYALVQKLFLILSILHFAILTPLWSAYTEAVASKDIEWVKKMLKYSVIYSVLLFTVGSLGLYIFGKPIIFLWTGKTITNDLLYAFMGMSVFITGWVSCFSVFLNGIGKLKVQTMLLIPSAVIYIPLSLYLGAKFGVVGICLASIVVLIPLAISDPIQSVMSLRHFDKICKRELN